MDTASLVRGPSQRRSDMAKSRRKKTESRGGLTPEKAREILSDGQVRGKPLTDKQRRFFGAAASGAPPRE